MRKQQLYIITLPSNLRAAIYIYIYSYLALIVCISFISIVSWADPEGGGGGGGGGGGEIGGPLPPPTMKFNEL